MYKHIHYLEINVIIRVYINCSLLENCIFKSVLYKELDDKLEFVNLLVDNTNVENPLIVKEVK